MAGIVDIISLAVSGLTLLPLQGTYIPPTLDDQTTTVRIMTGARVNVLDPNIKGNVPGAALWDRDGQSIGTAFSNGDIMNENAYHDIYIVADSGMGNIDPEYIAITNGGNDAICIAGISLTLHSGAQSAWAADVAAACTNTGAFVYPSTRRIADSSPHTPYCVWIDRDGTNGIPHQGFGIHLPDFQCSAAQVKAYQENPDLMCQSGPRFRMYHELRTENPILTFNPVIDYTDQGTDVDPSQVINNPGVFASQDVFALRTACTRDYRLSECASLPKNTSVPIIDRRDHQYKGPRRRPQHQPLPSDADAVEHIKASEATEHEAMQIKSATPGPTRTIGNSSDHLTITNIIAKGHFHRHLVVSSQDYHSAVDVCQHPNSFGPSFASIPEGMFCDMVEKELYPICATKANDLCCFDIDKKAFQGCPDMENQPGASHHVRAEAASSNTRFTEVQFW